MAGETPSAEQQLQDVFVRVISCNDPAALLADETVVRLARGLVNSGCKTALPILGSEIDPTQLVHPNRTCESCGHSLSASSGKASKATLLDVSGFICKAHVPLRCRHRGCKCFGANHWHNYLVIDGQHLFRGQPSELRCVMLNSTFGCTVHWLKQFHLRLVREHVSFAGEAFVANHYQSEITDDGIALARLRLNIADAWYKWRMVLRMERMQKVAVEGVNLTLSV